VHLDDFQPQHQMLPRRCLEEENPAVLLLDSDALPRRDRLGLVVESLTGAAGATSFTPESDEVHLAMSMWELGGVELFDAQCSAHTLRGTGRPAAGHDRPALMLTSALRGTGVHTHLGRQVAFRPSRVWATDATAPYVHHVSDTRTLTTKVPFDALGMPVDVVRPGLHHLQNSPLAPLFTSHVVQVRRVADQVDRPTALALGTATLSLARALVASVAPESRAGREALQDALLLRVKAFVRQHLGETWLDAHAIAAAHHVSVRQLYKTCANADLRLEQWIIVERLARAAEDLARTSSRDLSVSLVARRWGFSSASHFTTRFRREYGVSPRAWQAINQASPGRKGPPGPQ
jgi:AraC-like DNA-binding protein